MGTVSLIRNAALAQRYVDALLPKPKLPRRAKKRAKFYTLAQIAKVIAASEEEQRVFYWLLAETGLRAGEIAGLRLEDIEGDRLTVNQSIWGGKEQSPKTNSAVRTLGLSPQLLGLGADGTAEATETCLCVFVFDGYATRHERVSATQDDAVTQVARHPRSRVSCLPPLQRVPVGRFARATEDDSGTGRTRSDWRFHLGRVRRSARMGAQP